MSHDGTKEYLKTIKDREIKINDQNDANYNKNVENTAAELGNCIDRIMKNCINKLKNLDDNRVKALNTISKVYETYFEAEYTTEVSDRLLLKPHVMPYKRAKYQYYMCGDNFNFLNKSTLMSFNPKLFTSFTNSNQLCETYNHKMIRKHLHPDNQTSVPYIKSSLTTNRSKMKTSIKYVNQTPCFYSQINPLQITTPIVYSDYKNCPKNIIFNYVVKNRLYLKSFVKEFQEMHTKNKHEKSIASESIRKTDIQILPPEKFIKKKQLHEDKVKKTYNSSSTNILSLNPKD
ncbi:hypothetical protein HZS_4217, partial [Henneguya salminicola]